MSNIFHIAPSHSGKLSLHDVLAAIRLFDSPRAAMVASATHVDPDVLHLAPRVDAGPLSRRIAAWRSTNLCSLFVRL